MIDLSNNNGTGHDFHRAYASGHRRAYFKASEGNGFTDRVSPAEAAAAHKAGFRVGAYHFARGEGTPLEEFKRFRSAIEHWPVQLQLRPALDLEAGPANERLGQWAAEWLQLCRRELGVAAIVYGSSSFLADCRFRHVPGPLWLASYGRNDGREHPYSVPQPWAVASAHQFTSQALVPGIRGRCDVSHVYAGSAIDWPHH